jgi:hypothetical protein
MATIYVEVRPKIQNAGDLTPTPTIPELFVKRVEEIGDSIVEVADKLRSRIEKLAHEKESAWTLDQVELKFGLQLQSEAGVVIAKATAGATFDATIKWKSKQV